MTADEISRYVESFGGVLTTHPTPGDGSPEAALGDLFFYYAGREGPERSTVRDRGDQRLPRGAIIKARVRGLPGSNIDARRRGQSENEDPGRRDEVLPHPVYGPLGWVCIVQAGPRASEELRALLHDAHGAARRRWDRRQA